MIAFLLETLKSIILLYTGYFLGDSQKNASLVKNVHKEDFIMDTMSVLLKTDLKPDRYYIVYICSEIHAEIYNFYGLISVDKDGEKKIFADEDNPLGVSFHDDNKRMYINNFTNYDFILGSITFMEL